MDHILVTHGHRISRWNFDIQSPAMLQEYVAIIHAKGAPCHKTTALDLLMERSGRFLALANTKELYTMIVNVYVR